MTLSNMDYSSTHNKIDLLVTEPVVFFFSLWVRSLLENAGQSIV